MILGEEFVIVIQIDTVIHQHSPSVGEVWSEKTMARPSLMRRIQDDA